VQAQWIQESGIWPQGKQPEEQREKSVNIETASRGMQVKGEGFLASRFPVFRGPSPTCKKCLRVVKKDMKARVFFSILILPATLMAQDFVAPQGREREITTQAPELKPEIDGIVKQIFDVEKPWQLLNPAAPASYGTGEKNVSKDTVAGTPHHSVTLTVVGVEW
jgi:hypothetical protein